MPAFQTGSACCHVWMIKATWSCSPAQKLWREIKTRPLLLLKPWITVRKCGGNNDTVIYFTDGTLPLAKESSEACLRCLDVFPGSFFSDYTRVRGGRWFTFTVASTVGATVTSPDTLIPIKAQRKAEVTKTSCEVSSHCARRPRPSAAPPRMSPALVQRFLSFYSQHFLFLSSSADQQED